MRCFKNDISVLNAAVHFFKSAVVGYVIDNCLFCVVAVRKRNFDKNGAVRLNLVSVNKGCDVKKSLLIVTLFCVEDMI